MKKLLVIFGVIMVFALGVTAQEEQEPTVGLAGFGFKAGLDLADNYGSDASGTDMKLGFIGGGFVEFAVAEYVAIQPEVLYAMKGFKESTFDIKFKTDYLEIPVLIKFKIPTQSTVKPNLYVGPDLGILLSAKMTNGGSVDLKDIYKTTDFGIAFGGGIDVRMETFSLVFDARYTLGLTKLIDVDGYNSYFGYTPADPEYLTESPNVKNSNLSFMVGVMFK